MNKGTNTETVISAPLRLMATRFPTLRDALQQDQHCARAISAFRRRMAARMFRCSSTEGAAANRNYARRLHSPLPYARPDAPRVRHEDALGKGLARISSPLAAKFFNQFGAAADPRMGKNLRRLSDFSDRRTCKAVASEIANKGKYLNPSQQCRHQSPQPEQR